MWCCSTVVCKADDSECCVRNPEKCMHYLWNACCICIHICMLFHFNNFSRVLHPKQCSQRTEKKAVLCIITYHGYPKRPPKAPEPSLLHKISAAFLLLHRGALGACTMKQYSNHGIFLVIWLYQAKQSKLCQHGVTTVVIILVCQCRFYYKRIQI